MHVPIRKIVEKAVDQLTPHTVCAVVKSFDFHGSKDLFVVCLVMMSGSLIGGAGTCSLYLHC
jgi:hypothetical protein